MTLSPLDRPTKETLREKTDDETLQFASTCPTIREGSEGEEKWPLALSPQRARRTNVTQSERAGVQCRASADHLAELGKPLNFAYSQDIIS